MVDGGTMVLPRVSASSFDVEALNWFLARPCANRRARLTLKYADGSSEYLYSSDWNYSSRGFEYVFHRSSPVDKDVVQMTIDLCQMDSACSSPGGDGCKVFMVFNGSVSNPVFKSGDVIQFKIVFSNSVSVS